MNANARRNHKRRKNHPRKQLSTDTNADIVQRKSAEEKDLSRREQLKQQVSAFTAHRLLLG